MSVCSSESLLDGWRTFLDVCVVLDCEGGVFLTFGITVKLWAATGSVIRTFLAETTHIEEHVTIVIGFIILADHLGTCHRLV